MSTVGEFVRALLGHVPQNPQWQKPPLSPIDVFAVTASLLKRSGAYQHVLPTPGVVDNGVALLVTKKEQRKVADAAEQWRNRKIKDARVPATIQAWWHDLTTEFDSPVLARPPSGSAVAEPEWWRPALLLMIAADSACQGLGFAEHHSFRSEDDVFSNGTFIDLYQHRLIQEGQRPPASLSNVSADLHCVLPKSRTPNVGATLRSLSHHLALLPPEGIAAARWINRVNEVVAPDPLNLLLVPFPYSIDARCFQPDTHNENENWGSFNLDQRWLTDDDGARLRFVNFVEELIVAARREVSRVHAVVLPEMALDALYFELLSRTLQNSSELEFLVSGVSEKSSGEKGNYVATTYYYSENRPDRAVPGTSRTERARTVHVRAKHHRWKLDENQIRRYALSSFLDPTRSWWENFNIEPREVDVVRFRRNSTLATLICEDLARVDPCQELIRALGPNLVLVLLMDGPQLKPRWPARYASVLADDPGSSVLTLTSLGLINRQRNNASACQPSIGLWKDHRSDAQEIVLPPGYHAVALTLNPRTECAFTIDGRERKASVSWSLGGIHPIRLENPEPYSALLSGSG